MDSNDALSLSAYKDVAVIDEKHRVYLVQNIYSNHFFVKKYVKEYNLKLYESLRENPVLNMPKIYELAEDDGFLVVIEEFIDGNTLRETIDSYGAMSADSVISIGISLCKVLEDLHSRNPAIIHRDIKPENIIISPDGIVKLLDVSAAKFYTQTGYQDTTLIGTVDYAAPEQYGFGISSAQTDIYAVGVLLNVLLTTKTPKESPFSGKLGEIISKCTKMEPTERYTSARELELALSEICKNNSGEDISSKNHLHNWKKYLPPGFRSLKMPNMILATVSYLTVFYMTSTVDVENVTHGALVLNRIMLTVAMICIIFFSFNYLDVQKRVPLTSSSHTVVRIFGILLYDFLFLFFAAGIAVLFS